MSARARITALSFAAFLFAVASSCTPAPEPAPEGVGPSSSPRRPESARTALDLARPEPSAPVLPPPTEAPPVPAPTPAPQDAGQAVDVSDLGPFDVITWDEARARSEKQIQAENADAELEKVRAELENRP